MPKSKQYKLFHNGGHWSQRLAFYQSNTAIKSYFIAIKVKTITVTATVVKDIFLFRSSSDLISDNTAA